MKRSRFSDEQVIAILKENEAGSKVDDLPALSWRGLAGADQEATQATASGSDRAAGAKPADATLVARLRERPARRPSALPHREHRRRSQSVLPGPDRRRVDLGRTVGPLPRRARRAPRPAAGDRSRQRPRGHQPGDVPVVRAHRCPAALHRARQARPERLRRELQRPPTRRVPQPALVPLAAARP